MMNHTAFEGDVMPAVIVRKRLGRKSFAMSYHLNRWYWRNRANLAVSAAFLVACGLGLVVSTGVLRTLFQI
jgi:hypothetical protein